VTGACGGLISCNVDHDVDQGVSIVCVLIIKYLILLVPGAGFEPTTNGLQKRRPPLTLPNKTVDPSPIAIDFSCRLSVRYPKLPTWGNGA
jgi:hypothetical protein